MFPCQMSQLFKSCMLQCQRSCRLKNMPIFYAKKMALFYRIIIFAHLETNIVLF